ncbi:MAG: pyridoxamine 5'-phosphate oxidase family protein [Magnetospirillum sp.]|nr:pyridoxamine 5'-phosphate oxidase family protein [Magnetospirillum sp.]
MSEPQASAVAGEIPGNNRLALRRVARACRKAALATSLDGGPYVSLVTVAFDHDLSPILLLSRLADHTRNLLVDARVSLLLDGTDGHPNPQTGPRVTLTGIAMESGDPRLKARFLARHPGAALYAGFGDFSIWRVGLDRGHFVGGFGRAVWFDAPLVPFEDAASFQGGEEGWLAEINRDRPDLVSALAGVAGGDPQGGWQLVGLDPDGCEMGAAGTILRLAFEQPPAVGESPLMALQALAARQIT